MDEARNEGEKTGRKRDEGAVTKKLDGKGESSAGSIRGNCRGHSGVSRRPIELPLWKLALGGLCADGRANGTSI